MTTETAVSLSPRLTLRPAVLQALGVLGIGDAAVARLVRCSPGAVGNWAQGLRPIPVATQIGLLYIVPLLSAALGRDDPSLSPHAASRLRAARSAADLLFKAARAELPAELSDAEIDAGAELGQDLLRRLEVQARRERLAWLQRQLRRIKRAEGQAEEQRSAIERQISELQKGRK